MCRILIVDDEVHIRKAIREYCEFKGYRVEEAGDGMEAVELCRRQDFDAIVMDVMLPKLNGFSACQEILKDKYIPILMLSARGDEYDKLFGFELGIEDYMVKPFSPMELIARLRVMLRRHEGTRPAVEVAEQGEPTGFAYRGLQADYRQKTLTVDGDPVYLPAKAMELLLYLMKHPNELIPREQLFRDVWGYTYMGNDRTIDTHIKLIRSGLGNYRSLLTTARNRGYRLEVPEE